MTPHRTLRHTCKWGSAGDTVETAGGGSVMGGAVMDGVPLVLPATREKAQWGRSALQYFHNPAGYLGLRTRHSTLGANTVGHSWGTPGEVVNERGRVIKVWWGACVTEARKPASSRSSTTLPTDGHGSADNARKVWACGGSW